MLALCANGVEGICIYHEKASNDKCLLHSKNWVMSLSK